MQTQVRERQYQSTKVINKIYMLTLKQVIRSRETLYKLMILQHTISQKFVSLVDLNLTILIAQRSVSRYQFVKIPHSTGIPEFIYGKITLEGYKVYGLCQYKGTLDYVVALEENTNEIHVIKLTYESSTDEATIYVYKKVDKDDTYKKLEGNIYVDCSYERKFQDLNTYVIGITGTYFHDNGISSFYLAKFSTKYNMTEYFVLSEDPTTMDIARGVKVDFDNRMVYLAVEINKQKYYNRTVYSPGSSPGNDNANVAIHGYSWTYGVRMWTTVIGNQQFTDYFSRMLNYGNYLYVFLNSYSIEYTTNSSQTDIYYYRMRASNGYIESEKIFGSSQDDKVLDLQINYNGLFVLALINDQLLPHQSNDKIWQTQNKVQNLALIQLDFDDNILVIEGYDLDNMPTPYPQKVFVKRTTGLNQTFVFVGPRSNADIDINGGFYITYFAESYKAFSQTAGCGDTCSRCSPELTSKCLQCKTSYMQYQHKCYSGTTCPDYFHNVYDDSGNALRYCKSCHYSCKTCTGPRSDQCQTCCTNSICGAIYDRVPSFGQCKCESGKTDSNGICVQRCVLNLAGKLDDMCYTQCPANSYPQLQYDQSTAQERSQYDLSSQTDCSQSSNHLKFSLNGKGLPLSGPSDMDSVPSEFTISFWVRPTVLGASTFFVNAFNRIRIKAVSSTQKVTFIFKTGASSQVEPVYTGDFKQKVVLDTWNYVSASLRSTTSGIFLKYEQILAIANNNMGVVYQAGYDNTQTSIIYTEFQNTIYLGAYSDSSPQSFLGIMKEFKLFTKFHGFAQMQDEQLRMYRYYSYDDPYLVSYWKLSENYNNSDIEYVINDYSIYSNSITYSKISKSDYPSFFYDQSQALTLCTFHDVNICKTVDYSKTHPYVVGGRRLTQSPTFLFQDKTLTISSGDQIWFVPNNTACVNTSLQAYMKYQGSPVNNWIIDDANYNPINLKTGIHYQVCYYISSTGVAFNLYQIYVVELPLTVDPSSSTAYQSDSVTRTWYSNGGDQSYGDMIKFSLNCDQPTKTDYEMMRLSKSTYGTQNIKDFQETGDYFFCWMPTFVQESSYPYYNSIHELRFKVVYVPSISTSAPPYANAGEDMVRFNLIGTFTDGDQMALAWRGSVISDCNPDNILGSKYTRNFSYWPSVWFGYEAGTYGVKNYTMDELHLCFMSAARDSPGAWSRVKKSKGTSYQMRIKEYNQTPNSKCPEFSSFTPVYGSTELYETDTTIKFSFKSQAVYPSLQQDSPTVYGKIVIFRGAIKSDGTIVKTSTILWSQTKLNDFTSPDPFQQGDLICSGTGSCTIILSQTSSRMKAGEIFYLSFYPNSFAAKPSKNSYTRYYLFNDKMLDSGQTTLYDHLFFCRSFLVYSSDQMINGKTFTMTGVDLKSKSIMQKEQSGSIISDTFTTKAINLYLTVKNTNDQYCTYNPPVATVSMEDITQTTFTVYNLELRQCNTGQLYADIELVRGIRDQYGIFTHVRAEWQKSVKIGDIKCDSTCMFCNGTTSSNCLICSDTNQYLLLGKCYSTCPSSYPYYQKISSVYQKKVYSQGYCLSECPYGTYPDLQTSECLSCNSDCQTCSSNYIASCLTCEPIKYYFNGICISDCPAPHYQSNYSSYMCDQISTTSYLKVKIQSLGYKTKIPKDFQTYLKAAIDNTDGGEILSIFWEQLEPTASSDEVTVFSSNSNGELDNRASVIKLKMTALNYMASTQVVKVKVTVTNTLGETAVDVYEFFHNQPPVAGYQNLTIVTGSGNGTTCDTIYRMLLENWDDNDSIYYRIYMKVDQVYYTVTDLTTVQDFYFKLPLFSDTYITKNIQICVSALDTFDAITYQCYWFNNVNNNLDYTTDFNKLRDHLSSLTYDNNMTNVIYASNNLFWAMKSPRRTPGSPGICTLDYHCNYNGYCSSEVGNQKCVCELGYSGTFCQFTGSQLPDFQAITEKMVTALYNTINSRYEIEATDIELLGNTLRGILKDPDIVDDTVFVTILELIEKIGSATLYAHYPVTPDVRNIYLDALSAVLFKLYHSYKVQRALPKTQALANGMSLSDQYSYSNSQSSRRRILSSSEEYAIGGVSTRLENDDSQSFQSSESILYQNWGRRIDKQINIFIDYFLAKINPLTPSYSYTSDAFQVMTKAGFASQYKGQQIYINELDVSWYIPSSVFENAQGKASDKHEVLMKVMKYIANPFLFEPNPGAFVESNVTTLTFFDSAREHINITLTSAKEYIVIMEPYQKTQAFESELIRCMAWDDDSYQFVNDGSCAFNQIYSPIPCDTCDDSVVINTSVSICRCKHLSRFAVVYQQTYPNNGIGVKVGIYTDYFAMQYWMDSFGFYLMIAGSFIYLSGLLITFIMDRKTERIMIEKLRERVRKLELKGFKQKEAKKLSVKRDMDGNIIFIRHNVEEKKEEAKKDLKSIQNQGEITKVQELKKPDEIPLKPKKKALTTQKKFQDDDVNEAQLLPAKGKKLGKKPKKGQVKANNDLNSSQQLHIETDRTQIRDDEEMKSPDALRPKVVNDDLVEDADEEAKKKREADLFEQQMMVRYREEKEIQEFIKVHGTSSSEEDINEKNRSKTQKKYMKLEKRAKEAYQYSFKQLIIHGSYVLSILNVKSLLSPRHVRWSLMFSLVFLNFFWCSVIYKNTKDPLTLPNSVSRFLLTKLQDRSSKDVASDDIWVSIISPMGSMILMYIFAGMFKLSDRRIVNSYTTIYFEQMLVELRKEMRLRFILAYSITLALYAAMLWYVVSFTAIYGWSVSWVWWYSCCFSVFNQFVLYDTSISITHWVTYYCSRSLALFWMKIRIIKQATSEA